MLAKKILAISIMCLLYFNITIANHSDGDEKSFEITYKKKNLDLNIVCNDQSNEKVYFGLENDDTYDVLVMSRRESDKNSYLLPKSISYTHLNEELSIAGKKYSGLIRFYEHYPNRSMQGKKYNLIRKYLLLLETGVEGKSDLYVIFFDINKKIMNSLLQLDHQMLYAKEKKEFLSLLMESSRLKEDTTMDNNQAFAKDFMKCTSSYSGNKKFN
jgi:hypothetical protein